MGRRLASWPEKGLSDRSASHAENFFVQKIHLEIKKSSSERGERNMSGWGGKRPGAGRKRKPIETPNPECLDLSARFQRLPPDRAGLANRAVLALAAHSANLADIAAVLN